MSSAKPERSRAVGRPIASIGLRTRMRGVVGPVVVVVWLVVLGAITSAVWLHVTGTDQPFRQPATDPAAIGRAIGQWWIIATTVGVLVLVPIIAAGCIAGAREHHSLAPWRVSLLRPRSIVGGHLITCVAFVLLLAAVATPIAALAWGLGGIGPAELGAGLGCSVLTGLVVACVALAVSSLTRRTATALLCTYLLLGLLVGGSAVLHAASDRSDGRPVDAVLLANPVVAGADAAASTTGHRGAPRAAAADAPIDHLSRLVHRGNHAAGPFDAAWPTTLAAAALLALLALLVADLGVRRQRAR